LSILGGFTQAIKSGWQYIASAVEKGIEKAEGFAQFVSGGMEIPEEAFAGTYGTLSTAEKSWDKISLIPDTYKLSKNFGIYSPFDWDRKHVLKMKVEYFDFKTKTFGSQWVTVESDKELTIAEWKENAQEAVTDSPAGYDYQLLAFTSFQYYLRPEA